MPEASPRARLALTSAVSLPSGLVLGLMVSLAGCARETAPAGDAGADRDQSARRWPDAEPWPDASHATGLAERPKNGSCLAFKRPGTDTRVRLMDAFPGLPALDKPLFLGQAPGDDSYFYAIEQAGRVMRFRAGAPRELQVVLDIRDAVESRPSEAGLLGLAFAPDFSTSGEVYLSYTRRSGELRSRISRWHSGDAGSSIDRTSEELILELAQPYSNHNGGQIAFGPAEGPQGQRYLYVGLGDGGSGGDPQGHGQNTHTLLGSLLRIDVGSGDPYAIPADNPFADGIDGRAEIYAWGLRNPWRFSFDRATGQLWAGDVGQGSREEIDRIALGGNYGWNQREGSRCFKSDCTSAGLVDPVVEYARDQGRSVTGGYVYRGETIPQLIGSYVYGDYVSGRVWEIVYDSDGTPSSRLLLDSGIQLSSFAEDHAGELYLLGHVSGRVLRLAPAGDASDDPGPPQKLSQTGCFEPSDPRQPVAGLIPYDVSVGLWSDGLGKRRWFALPDGETIELTADGDFDLPPGSVTVKEFGSGDQLIETRLFVRHDDGWAGYSYLWNSEQTDATLLPAGQRVSLPGGGSWPIPSRAECLSCHTAAAGRTLGLELAQLDRVFRYPNGRAAPQVATLMHLGLLPERPAAPAIEPLPQLWGSATPGSRARAYLHANCAFCHQPNGPGRGALDLRFSLPLDQTGLCNEPPQNGDLGLEDPRLLLPGNVARSVLPERLRKTGIARMPPLGSEVIDEQAVQLIETWIAGLAGCAAPTGGTTP